MVRVSTEGNMLAYIYIYIYRHTIKIKFTFALEQATKAQRGSRSIALLFLQQRRYMGVGGQPHVLAALPAGNTRYLLRRRLSGPQGRSGRVRKISPPNGIRSPTVQPVPSRYTDFSIPTHYLRIYIYIYIYIYIAWLIPHACDHL
jgi:hypothetical protein